VLMMDKVGGEVDHTDVVAVDQGGPRWEVEQLLKEPTEPTHLCHTVGHGTAAVVVSTRVPSEAPF
jgi:hypothetical protein